jgi:biotin synthase-related radical SAM superfamily protein
MVQKNSYSTYGAYQKALIKVTAREVSLSTIINAFKEKEGFLGHIKSAIKDLILAIIIHLKKKLESKVGLAEAGQGLRALTTELLKIPAKTSGTT